MSRGADTGCNRSKPFALQQWSDAIRTVRNHPSAFAFSMGNEAYAPPHELVEEFYVAAKRVSPDALVIDTDGCCVKYVSPSILLRAFAANVCSFHIFEYKIIVVSTGQTATARARRRRQWTGRRATAAPTTTWSLTWATAI